jgi:hypothetical protein
MVLLVISSSASQVWRNNVENLKKMNFFFLYFHHYLDIHAMQTSASENPDNLMTRKIIRVFTCTGPSVKGKVLFAI